LKQIADIKSIDMTKEINNYIREFETIYNGEPWYGKSLMAVINNADPKDVFKKQKSTAHSAYEITHHLYAWRDLLVKRLKGDTKASIEVNSKEDWASLPKDQTTATWKELIKKLEQNQQELIKALPGWNDEALDKDFAGTSYSLRTFLNGQIQHDIYHIGQIALALKNA
jgi:uncharacterized damage-inducible protein DinB